MSHFLTASIVLLLMNSASTASDPAPDPIARAHEGMAPEDERMNWWREARFGLFIHWGLYAIPAGEWIGDAGHAEWIRTTAQITLSEYDLLVEQFNPVNFSAEEWARLAKEAGMRYIVITSKHHDGFCLFDSAQTDFDIMSTPFQRDIMKELSDATRAQGLRMGWYHSIMDWHHPDYLPRRDWETNRSSDGADFDRFVEYLHAQVEELLTNYGDIGVMWFDGEWENTWTHEHGIALYDHVRAIAPSTIINNRVDKGRAGMAGLTVNDSFRGDFGTPEQEIPPTGLPGIDWETCMTMNDHWGYNAQDSNWKSTTQLVRTLVDVASKGGNFLLNVGPKADGTFPEESTIRLREIGAWMNVNGESIYGTSASPFGALPWGRCTTKSIPDDATRLYLHVFDWPADGRLVVPGLANEVRSANLLGDERLALSGWRENSDVIIEVPAESPSPHSSVIALDVSGAPVVYLPPAITVPSAEFVDMVEITIDAGDPRIEAIYFTIDGSDPLGPSAARYQGPFRLSSSSATIRARGYIGDRAVTPQSVFRVRRVEPRPPEVVDAKHLAAGMRSEAFRGDWTRLPDFASLQATDSSIAEGISLPATREEHIARRFAGLVEVAADDVYEFSLTSDDGARLLVGEKVVINNDGLHVAQEKRGTIALAKGLHPITIEWFNRTGDADLEVKMARAGEPMKPVEPSKLFHQRD